MMCILRAVILVQLVSVIAAKWENDTGLQNGDFHKNGPLAAPADSWLVPQSSYISQLASTICYFLPSTCSILENFFPRGVVEARGPKDLIAIISTMLATLLGAILVKLGVLIVLSVISIAIGKLLLIVLTLKTHLFGHKIQAQPIVYEKVYYPHGNIHRDWHPQMEQPYVDEQNSYDETVYRK